MVTAARIAGWLSVGTAGTSRRGKGSRRASRTRSDRRLWGSELQAPPAVRAGEGDGLAPPGGGFELLFGFTIGADTAHRDRYHRGTGTLQEAVDPKREESGDQKEMRHGYEHRGGGSGPPRGQSQPRASHALRAVERDKLDHDLSRAAAITGERTVPFLSLIFDAHGRNLARAPGTGELDGVVTNARAAHTVARAHHHS